MLDYINLTKEELEEIKHKHFSYGSESTTHIIRENENEQVMKIFKKTSFVDNKVKKIHLIKDRLKDCKYVVTADSIVTCDNSIVGYTMPKIEGKTFYYLEYKNNDLLYILKDISNKLKELHNLGVVCADFYHNIIIGEDGNLYFIDHDNFAIDNLKVDTENQFLETYNKSIKIFDKNFDNYLFNIFTLSSFKKIFMPIIYDEYKFKQRKFNCNDKIIRKIIQNTFNLDSVYDESLIIDHLNTSKDLKKIKQKIF